MQIFVNFRVKRRLKLVGLKTEGRPEHSLSWRFVHSASHMMHHILTVFLFVHHIIKILGYLLVNDDGSDFSAFEEVI